MNQTHPAIERKKAFFANNINKYNYTCDHDAKRLSIYNNNYALYLKFQYGQEIFNKAILTMKKDNHTVCFKPKYKNWRQIPTRITRQYRKMIKYAYEITENIDSTWMIGFNKRLGVYYNKLIRDMDFCELKPHEKLIRLYFKKTWCYKYFYDQINNNECYEVLKNNEWARTAFITWLLRCGFFYRTFQQTKYRKLIENTPHAYINHVGKIDTYLLPTQKSPVEIFYSSVFGHKVDMEQIIKFFNKEKCYLPCMHSVALTYNSKAVLTSLNTVIDVIKYESFYDYLNFHNIKFIRHIINNTMLSQKKLNYLNCCLAYIREKSDTLKKSEEMKNLLLEAKLQSI